MAEELCLDAGCVLPTRHDGPCRYKADGHSAARVSEWPQEDVERAARALTTKPWLAGSVLTGDEARALARAVLEASEAVPKVEHDESLGEALAAFDEARVRADRAEALCKSYGAALEQIEAVGDRNFLDPAEKDRPAPIARAALEGSVPADQEPTG